MSRESLELRFRFLVSNPLPRNLLSFTLDAHFPLDSGSMLFNDSFESQTLANSKRCLWNLLHPPLAVALDQKLV